MPTHQQIENRAITLLDLSGRDGFLVNGLAQTDTLEAVYQAIVKQPVDVDVYQCERQYPNGAWLAANARSLLAAKLGRGEHPTPYSHIWHRYFHQPHDPKAFRTSLKVVAVLSDARTLLADLVVVAEPCLPQEEGIAPAPATALMLLHADLVHAIERHKQPGFRILYDLKVDKQAGLMQFGQTSLGGAAAVAIRLAVTGKYTQSNYVVAAKVHEADLNLLEHVGGEADKLIGVAGNHISGIILAEDTLARESARALRERHPGFAIHTARTVDQAMAFCTTHRLERDCCPLDDAHYLVDSYVEEATRFFRDDHENALTLQRAGKVGKSSIFTRLIQQARGYQPKWNVLVADLSTYQSTSDTSDFVARLLDDYAVEAPHLVPAFTRSQESGGARFRLFLNHALPQGKLLLAFERSEYLKGKGPGREFFSLLRDLHQAARGGNDLLKQLRILIVSGPGSYASAAPDSPFNVGHHLTIEWDRWAGKNSDRVAELNRLHGEPLQPAEFPELRAFVKGNPFLVRACIYELATLDRRPPDKPLRQIWRESKAIRNHLDDVASMLKIGDEACRAKRLPESDLPTNKLRAVLSGTALALTAVEDLEALGLVVAKDNNVAISCELYREHFSGRLGVEAAERPRQLLDWFRR